MWNQQFNFSCCYLPNVLTSIHFKINVISLFIKVQKVQILKNQAKNNLLCCCCCWKTLRFHLKWNLFHLFPPSATAYCLITSSVHEKLSEICVWICLLWNLSSHFIFVRHFRCWKVRNFTSSCYWIFCNLMKCYIRHRM